MNLFSSPYIVVPFVAWFIAQATKFAIKASSGDVSWKYFYKSGNMPSSHTAIVTALMVVLAFLSGVESPEFGIGAVFSLIVIYDALNVRRAVGEQGGVLARLLELSRTPKSEREAIRIREVLGHTPLEVAAGGTIGIVASILLMFRYWPEPAQRLITDTSQGERTLYFVFFAIVVATGLVINRFYARKHYRKLPTSNRIQRSVHSSLIIPGLTGLLMVWLQSESVRFFTAKFWIIAVIIWIAVGSLIAYFRVVRGSKQALTEESKHFKEAKKRQRRKRSKRKQKRKK